MLLVFAEMQFISLFLGYDIPSPGDALP